MFVAHIVAFRFYRLLAPCAQLQALSSPRKTETEIGKLSVNLDHLLVELRH